MSIEYVKTTFGYHFFDEVDPAHKGKVAVFNIANGAGYIPGIGLVVGVARAIFYWKTTRGNENENSDWNWKVCRLQIARGIVESLGFGIAFLVADILVTVERKQLKTELPHQVSEVETPVNDEIIEDIYGYDRSLCSEFDEAWKRGYL